MKMSISVKDAMDTDVVFIDAKKTVMDSLKMMLQNNVWSIVVSKGGLPEGVVTERDILRKCIMKRIILFDSESNGRIFLCDESIQKQFSLFSGWLSHNHHRDCRSIHRCLGFWWLLQKSSWNPHNNDRRSCHRVELCPARAQQDGNRNRLEKAEFSGSIRRKLARASPTELANDHIK